MINGSKDQVAVIFGKGDNVLTVIFIYLELYNRNQKILLKKLINKPLLYNRIIIIGNFNAYYPI